ncbi:hypothetical protein T492DRAFT_838850 [Pavlovales sp. CCMP2436]|nr:hypothetical protein T492DRAFT_838850 [Pavlovales sp. CCMP2436]
MTAVSGAAMAKGAIGAAVAGLGTTAVVDYTGATKSGAAICDCGHHTAEAARRTYALFDLIGYTESMSQSATGLLQSPSNPKQFPSNPKQSPGSCGYRGQLPRELGLGVGEIGSSRRNKGFGLGLELPGEYKGLQSP